MSDQFNVDPLRLYFGDPYQITDTITVYQPTIQDIMEYGENEFFSMLYCFIGNTTYRRLTLWQSGIDWNKISDYELFCNLVHMLSVDQTRILFGEIDFQKFDLYQLNDVELPEDPPDKKLTSAEKRKKAFLEYELQHVFYNEEQNIVITAEDYKKIAAVLRAMVHMYPKSEYAANKISKELIIQEEQNKLTRVELEQKDVPTSTLLPLVSFCVNHPGFKYKTSELKEIHINEFMDSVRRLQVYESTHALYSGMYSGFCDTSKIPRSEFDFMRPINTTM